MSEAQWERISLLAYYGYQYNDNGYDHSNNKWYAITQVMIWRTTNPESDIYFTNTLNGNRISQFDSEIAEMERLVANHYKTPQFESGKTVPIGSTINLNDSNNVLSNYKITGTNNVSASVNGNTLSITANTVGEGSITFEKTATKYEIPPIVYFSDHSQNVMRVGNYDPVKSKYTLKVIGGRVTPNKKDMETRTNTAQGEATLGGAVYGIYKEDGTRMGSVTTKEDGTNTSDYLPELGRFYLLEEKASEGYLLDSTKYYFEITEDNLNPTVQVFEQVIKLDFEFTKVYASDKTEIMTPEVGVKFGVYNNKNELVEKITTDNQGIFRFTLPYGTYTIKQLTTTKGHEKIKDFKVEVKDVGNVVKKVISNAPITAKLRVVKIDAESKEVIKRANIKFKIFDVKNNKYVCQTITYPNKKTICEWEIDSNGEFTTAYPLMTGTYRLEEVDQKLDGYLWNKVSHEFSIDDDSKLRTDSEYGIIFDTDFENQRVKGQIKVEKIGEVAELTDKGFIFKKQSLSGVSFGLYALEDIVWNDKVIYKKDTLIQEKETDKDGNIIFNELYLGKYYIKETKTLDNYVLDTNKYNVELIYKDQYTPVIVYSKTLLNYLKTGKLEFTKTDISESKTLPNTLIEIYTDEDKLVFSGRTDEKGKIIIENLKYGKYYILEKEAPAGYTLNDEKMWFEILEDGKVVKSTMSDDKIIVEVPNTLKNDYIPFGMATLIVIGGGIVIYGTFKKKNKDNKKTKKKLIFVLGACMVTTLCGTLAYFTTTSKITNIFTTPLYQNKIVENFVSPTAWTPGTTTTKEVKVTNTGSINMAVRASYTEKWVNHNGKEISLTDSKGNRASIINFNDGWEKANDGYFYYGTKSNKKVLKPNEETNSFISGVTFNSNIESSLQENISNDGKAITFTSTGDGYDNATYTLTITIDTIQYDQANNVW